MIDKNNTIELYIKEAGCYYVDLDDVFLSKFLKSNGISYGDFLLCFPGGQRDLILIIMQQWNDSVIVKYNHENLSFSERIRLVMKLKIEAAFENEILFSNIFKFCLKPSSFDLSMKLIKSDTNWILEIVNDESLDFTYYTKRFTFGSVYIMTFLFAYRVKDLERTIDFFNKRIKNIVTFSKFKSKIMGAIKNKFGF